MRSVPLILLLASVVVCIGARAKEPAPAPAPVSNPATDPDPTSDPEPLSADEIAIREGVAAYELAFNKRDAKALASRWTEDAVYINRISGEEVVGRAAIEEQFVTLFKSQEGLHLKVSVESVQFLSPNVAVERGTANFVIPQQDPEQIDYNAVYVKRDGQWLLDRVTDKAPEIVPTHYEHLKILEWMVGSWVDQSEEARIETECHWTKNQTFLNRSYSISVDDRIEMSGMQIIGWDESAQTIRSWTFDSNGGFAEAEWVYKNDRWYISNKGVLADGRKASMVNVIKPVDENSFTWQTIERTAGGELLPNVEEVLIIRQ